MSRIGKKPIQIPAGVEADMQEGIVAARGPKGSLSVRIPHGFSIQKDKETLLVEPKKFQKGTRALWGTLRMNIANAVEGVSKGFQKTLELEGVGYRAAKEGNDLVLQLGFSHPVRFSPPIGIEFQVEKNTISVSGADKHMVGLMAASIRAVRKPEPYKGKGIRYKGEVIRRKAGKKAVGAK